jgi:hypothetical protein
VKLPNVTRHVEHRCAMKKAARWCSGPKEKRVRFQHRHVKTAYRQRQRRAGIEIRLLPYGWPL